VSEGLQPLQLHGSVQLNGRELSHLPTHQRGVGLVFQDALLFPHMTVAENLLFAVPTCGTNGISLTNAQRQSRVQQALQEAELTGMGNRDPSTLSGGQRARVALMRALLAEPQALLLDEPFSKLDAALRAQLRPWVFAHVRERSIPVVLVTHDEQDVADPQRVVHLRATEESPAHV
jgi:putative thiamine transport system ATP-binding protein